MPITLEVLFTPADCDALRQRDLSQTTCVVFDVLRATSTMVTALANGAVGIWPVSEISEAMAIRKANPAVLLAGEREGLRIRATQTGGVDFDLGNSPREFTPERVAGKTIVMTTTNGTRALRASAHAKDVLIGSLLNLSSVAEWITASDVQQLLLVCSGTHDQASYEDTLAAGALCDLLWNKYSSGKVEDSATMARIVYRGGQADLFKAMGNARNGRRLLGIPELAEDVRVCANRDSLPLTAALMSDGIIRKISRKQP